MRQLIASGLLLALLVSPSFAETIRECPDEIRLLAPGSSLPSGAVPSFRWSAEPGRTAARDVVIATAANAAVQQIGSAGPFKGSFQLPDGDYVWFVTFKNAAGTPICRSTVAALTIGGETRYAGGGSLSGATGGDPLKITLNAAGRYVIVMRNSRYSGVYTAKIDSDDFNAASFALNGGVGLEIHGNDLKNVVTGSSGSDIIVLYDGDDIAEGGLGNDTIHGGRGNDTLNDVAGGGDFDFLMGGPGGDSMNVDDGDPNDTMRGGSVPTGVDGGVGNGGDDGANTGPDGII